MGSRPPRSALVVACTLVLVGCEGSHPAKHAGQPPPGKVERAARSNAHKEIPTRFGRAVQLPYRSTVLLATAIRAAEPVPVRPSVGRGGRVVGVVVGIRNIGRTDWAGSVAALSKLAVSRRDKPERIVRSLGASEGPCPSVLIQTRASVTARPLVVRAGRTAFECVRFLVPRRDNPILFKVAAQASDYTRVAALHGRGYGVWALPGTLVEKCRYFPGTVKGRCHGLEVGED
jgi:hypothetical protein